MEEQFPGKKTLTKTVKNPTSCLRHEKLERPSRPLWPPEAKHTVYKKHPFLRQVAEAAGPQTTHFPTQFLMPGLPCIKTKKDTTGKEN